MRIHWENPGHGAEKSNAYTIFGGFQSCFSDAHWQAAKTNSRRIKKVWWYVSWVSTRTPFLLVLSLWPDWRWLGELSSTLVSNAVSRSEPGFACIHREPLGWKKVGSRGPDAVCKCQTWVHQNRAILCCHGGDFYRSPAKARDFYKAPRMHESLRSRIASERRFFLRLEGQICSHSEFPAIPESVVKIASEWRCAILVLSVPQIWETDFYAPPVLRGAALSDNSATAVYKMQGP